MSKETDLQRADRVIELYNIFRERLPVSVPPAEIFDNNAHYRDIESKANLHRDSLAMKGALILASTGERRSNDVAAFIEALGMLSENLWRFQIGETISYGEDGFFELIKKYGLQTSTDSESSEP